MHNQEPLYALGNSDSEHARLSAQARFYSEMTEHIFRLAGLASGMRVLDLGCGVGDVSFLVASIVGPSGCVIGVDKSAEAIAKARARAQAAGLSHVRFEVANVTEFSPDGPVDALVGRLVLLYLADPAATLLRLAARVRPGGIIAFQEMEMSQFRSVPELPLVKTACDRIRETFARAGVATDIGPRLHQVFRAAGLPRPRMLLQCRVETEPDSAVWELCEMTTRSLLPMMVRFEIASEEEVGIDTLAERVRDEVIAADGALAIPPMVGAWTRLPA